jgi:hypothetical protein
VKEVRDGTRQSARDRCNHPWTLTELYWRPGQGVQQDVSAQIANDIGGTAGYHARDQIQHVIMGTKDSALIEVWWKARPGMRMRAFSASSEATSCPLPAYADADGYQL